MSVAALSVTTEREHVIDFTVPYYDFSGIVIIIKKPFPNEHWFRFTDVFSYVVWAWLGTAVLGSFRFRNEFLVRIK